MVKDIYGANGIRYIDLSTLSPLLAYPQYRPIHNIDLSTILSFSMELLTLGLVFTLLHFLCFFFKIYSQLKQDQGSIAPSKRTILWKDQYCGQVDIVDRLIMGIMQIGLYIYYHSLHIYLSPFAIRSICINIVERSILWIG